MRVNVKDNNSRSSNMDNGKNKVAAFGEILMRLSAYQSTDDGVNLYESCFGGTEANVLACLSRLGERTEYVSALPDTAMGKAVVTHLHNYGVGTERVIMRGDNLGLYFVEKGTGSRGASVIYYRKNSEFAKLDENSFDLSSVFDDVSLFHISGISFALSESSRRLAFKLVQGAKERKIPVSFDFNYREKLWTVDEAKPYLRAMAKLADIILAAPIDFSAFLGVKSTDEFFREYANCKKLFVRERKVVSDDKHSVRVEAYYNENGVVERYATETVLFDVIERVGGGDAFDGGILHSVMSGDGIADTVKNGVSAFIYKHSVKGDTFDGSVSDVKAVRDKIFGK